MGIERPCGVFDRNYSQDMAICRTRFQWAALIGFLLLLFGVFPLFASEYLLGVVNFIAITVIAVLGLQFLTGYCGQISIGHAAFMAVGAYTSAILTGHLGWSFWVALPCAAISAGIAGLIFAVPALRIKGFYIAVTTLAAHFVIMWAIVHGGDLTGGVMGLSAPAPKLGGLVFNSEKKFFFLIVLFAAVMTFFAKSIARGKIGRAFIAIRDNDIAAEFMGINVFAYKVLAFAIACLYAGVAGSLYAHYLGHVNEELFPLIESIWMLGMVIVGGPGSITGAIFGAAFIRLLSYGVYYLGPLVGAAIPTIEMSIANASTKLVFGLVIILFLVIEPRGLYHRWEIILAKIRLWPFPH
jgi:branched-chain amino acid transport system permease protein